MTCIQDITQQSLCEPGSVDLVEKCARFHVHCTARLCELSMQDFDQVGLSRFLLSLFFPEETRFKCFVFNRRKSMTRTSPSVYKL